MTEETPHARLADAEVHQLDGQSISRGRIFLISRYRGSVGHPEKDNVARARQVCRYLTFMGWRPVAPQLFYPQFLDDDIERERQRGMELGHEEMAECTAAVIDLEHGMSAGMTDDFMETFELMLDVCVLWGETPQSFRMQLLCSAEPTNESKARAQ